MASILHAQRPVAHHARQVTSSSRVASTRMHFSTNHSSNVLPGSCAMRSPSARILVASRQGVQAARHRRYGPPMSHKGLGGAPPPSGALQVRSCGIIGVFRQQGNVNVEIYEGLLMLQHRGQDSAGMVCTDWHKFRERKDNGLVKDVFSKKDTIEKLTGMLRRYSCCTSTAVTFSIFILKFQLRFFRVGRHRPRAVPHCRHRLCAGSAAILRQQPPGHLLDPQRQPHQHHTAAGHAPKQPFVLQPPHAHQF